MFSIGINVIIWKKDLPDCLVINSGHAANGKLQCSDLVSLTFVRNFTMCGIGQNPQYSRQGSEMLCPDS
jgi:hypothetical protein